MIVENMDVRERETGAQGKPIATERHLNAAEFCLHSIDVSPRVSFSVHSRTTAAALQCRRSATRPPTHPPAHSPTHPLTYAAPPPPFYPATHQCGR